MATNKSIVPAQEKRPTLAKIIRPEFNQLADIAAERAVLGAVLLDPEAYAPISERLQPGDFVMLQHGFIWYAFQKLDEAGTVIDIEAVAHFIDQQKAGDTRRGDDLIAYLAELLSAIPDSRNLDAHVRRVRQAAVACRVFNAAERMKELVAQGLRGDALVDEINKLVDASTDQREERRTDIKSIASRYYDTVETGIQAGEIPGVPTGSAKLDELIGGFSPGEVYILAGVEKQGKTTFALCLALSIAMQGYRIAYFSLEMSHEEIVRAMTSIVGGISRKKLKRFKLDDAEWTRFTEAVGRISELHIDVIDEYPNLTPLQMRKRVRRLQREHGLDLIILDGLWLMTADRTQENPSWPARYEEVTNIMIRLTEYAKELHLPILTLHQLKRNQVGNKPPDLSLLAESTGVARNAQVVMALQRVKDDYGFFLTMLHILADRNGDAQGEHANFTYKNYGYQDAKGNRYDSPF